MIILNCCQPIPIIAPVHTSIINLKDGLTLLIAFLLAIIAWQQFKVNKDKLRLDLFEKRYRVYNEVQKILNAILKDGIIKESEINFSILNEALFLFDKDVDKFIKNLILSIMRIASLHLVIGSNTIHITKKNSYTDEIDISLSKSDIVLNDSDKKEYLIQLNMELSKCNNYFIQMNTIFNKYLSFKHKTIEFNPLSLFESIKKNKRKKS